ncbi:MAG: hypothetical protein AB4372_10770 [Xenococcus sp. (in: cyanobacteria)]
MCHKNKQKDWYDLMEQELILSEPLPPKPSPEPFRKPIPNADWYQSLVDDLLDGVETLPDLEGQDLSDC